MHVTPYIPIILPLLVRDGFNSSDWSDRKSAVETVHKFMIVLRESMSPFVEEIIQTIDHLKFDKVSTMNWYFSEIILR